MLAGAAGVIAAPAVGGLAWRTARQRQAAKAWRSPPRTGSSNNASPRLVGSISGSSSGPGPREPGATGPARRAGAGPTRSSPALRPWERHFTVIQWDHRGAGKTLGRNGKAGSGPMTFDRRVADAIEVIEFLR